MRGGPGLRRAPPAERVVLRPGPAAPSGGEAMLPWKRHKFEVAGKAEGRGGAAASSSSSSSSAAAAAAAGPPSPSPPVPPAVPVPWPGESALGRLGRLLGGRRRQSFRVSRAAPSCGALYLGNAPTLQAKGEGCTEAAVGRIWARSEAGRRGARMTLSVGPQGLRLSPDGGAPPEPRAASSSSSSPSPPRPPGHLYLLHRLTYCGPDPRLPRLLAWVYRHEGRHKAVLLRCHAALLPKAAQARALALRLRQTAAAALAEFRRLKRRADARRQHQLQLQLQTQLRPAALPTRPVQLRGPAAAYRPPLQRGRSAPRLGPIAEDAQGEEREERAPRGRGRRRRRHSGPSQDSHPDPQHHHHHQQQDDASDGELLAPEEAEEALGQLAGELGELALGPEAALLLLRAPRRLSPPSAATDPTGPDPTDCA